MILVAQQPNYFPWLGYLEQMARADRIVLLDDVQWLRRGWQRRARVALHPGQMPSREDSCFQWLTIPLAGSQRHQRLEELVVDAATPWPRHHWNTLQAVYGRRPFFKGQLEPLIKPWLEGVSTRLRQEKQILLKNILRESLVICLAALGMEQKARGLIFSSELQTIDVPGFSAHAEKTDRLVRLCRALQAQTYYSGIGSTSYIDLAVFREAGIRVLWQRWRHPEYDQRGAQARERHAGAPAEKFVTHLSFLDALANMPLSEIMRALEPSAWGPFAPHHSLKNVLPP